MPIVGVRSTSLAKGLRAEAVAGRSAPRTQAMPTLPVRPGSLAALLPDAEGATARPRLNLPLVPTQLTGPAEQEPARTVIRAYQATRDAALPVQPASQAAADEVIQPAPARAAVRDVAERPAAREEGVDQRPAAPAAAGMVATSLVILPKPLLAASAETAAAAARRAPAGADGNAEQPGWEGGLTEAITLLTIVAAVCLGIWMLI